MMPAGPNHSNIILVAVIASVFGVCIYAMVLYFGGWRTLIGVFGISLLAWCLLILADHWPPR
jgi:hypothetical protein